MSHRWGELVRKYPEGGLLVDTNLLLLFLVGEVDRRSIVKKEFERTRDYDIADYQAVTDVITFFAPRIVTTPHVLTEVSNLANKLKGDRRARFYDKFSFWIELMSEVPLCGADVCRLGNFEIFGLTDLGILQAARGSHVVMTDDGGLSSHLQRNGVDVLTLREVRALGERPSS